MGKRVALDEGPIVAGDTPIGTHLVSADEVLESISDAFYAVDKEWRFTYINHVAEAWWGRRREDLFARVIWSEFPASVGSEPYKAHLIAAREGRVVRLEAVSPIIGRWVDISIFPNPHGLSVYFRDITDRKREEERQLLLQNELKHRVKNTLTTVQAIAAFSLRGEDVAAARDRFMARLVALSRANDLILAENWEGARFGEVAAQVLSPHSEPSEPSRIRFGGPDIVLKPQAATSLALTMHELTTNAVKHGALSTVSGSVELRWGLAGEGEEARLQMMWVESGGPPVQAPTSTGFGTRLLRGALCGDLRADIDIQYEPGGVICRITAPLGELVA